MTATQSIPTSASPTQLTFIGGGHLAQSLLQGIYGGNPWAADCRIAITARRAEHAEALRIKFPRSLVSLDNVDAAIWADPDHGANGTNMHRHVVFICTRPADVPGVCKELTPTLALMTAGLRPTVVTMCPGITAAQLRSWLPLRTAVVRTMPNTPVECCEGATGIFAGPDVAQSRVDLVTCTLRAVSPIIALLDEEPLLDVVAAIAGSAPAHIYYFLEALVAVGESHGLSPDMARQLVAQSCLGAGKLARDANVPLSKLRAEVCVPGGSTGKAISHLESKGVSKQVQAAVERSLEANRQMRAVE